MGYKQKKEDNIMTEFIYGIGLKEETDFGRLDYVSENNLPEITDDQAIFEIYEESGDLSRTYTNADGWN